MPTPYYAGERGACRWSTPAKRPAYAPPVMSSYAPDSNPCARKARMKRANSERPGGSGICAPRLPGSARQTGPPCRNPALCTQSFCRSALDLGRCSPDGANRATISATPCPRTACRCDPEPCRKPDNRYKCRVSPCAVRCDSHDFR